MSYAWLALCSLIVFISNASAVIYEQSVTARNAQIRNIMGVGSPWSTNNILCDSSTRTFLNYEHSDVLQLDHFEFSLPHDAQIYNISVLIQHSKYPWNTPGDFSKIALTFNNMEFKTDKIASSWNSQVNFDSFPRLGSNWEKTVWSRDEISDPSFGVRIQAHGAGYAIIDCVAITITFDSKEIFQSVPALHAIIPKATTGNVSTTDTLVPSFPSESPTPSPSLPSVTSPSPSAVPSPSQSASPSTSPSNPSDSLGSPSNSPSSTVLAGSPNSGGHSKKNSSGMIIGIIVAIAAVALALIVGAVLVMRRRKQHKNTDTAVASVELENQTNNHKSNPETSTANSNTPDPHYASFMRQSSIDNYQPIKTEQAFQEESYRSKDPKTLDYTIKYSELTLEREVGRGAYGVVYKAKWRSNDVAVKRLITEDMTERQTDEFAHEMTLMRTLRPSKNVVLLLGICEKPLCVVTEYCAKGSLLQLLESGEELSEQQLKRIINGIAKGMLHMHFEGIVHRDLAARNVLLTSDLEPKISDFGLSRALQAQENSAKTNSNVGPLKWMAPECIRNREYGTPSDVWAFGITLIEIFTRETPYGRLDALSVATRIATGELVPEVPKNTPQVIADLMKVCFSYLPKDRPTFQQICDHLESW